jgi:hypothetical protein
VSRRGVALLAALLSMLLLGALASLLLAVARIEALAGARSLARLRAQSAAIAGTELAIASWNPLLVPGWPPGQWTGTGAGSLSGGGRHSDSLLALGRSLYLLHSIGEARTADGTVVLGRDGLARLLELTAPALPDSAALFAAGAVSLADSALVDGADHPAPSPGCTPGAPEAGIGAGTGVVVSSRALRPGAGLYGSPPQRLDSAVTRAWVNGFVGPGSGRSGLRADFQLSASPGLVGPALTLSGVCDIAVASNWGAPGQPAHPCRDYFPVVELAPGSRVDAGVGQGVLVARGSLELGGDFVYDGVIVALGPLHLTQFAVVVGSVLSADSVTVSDGAHIERSRCVVTGLRTGASRPVTVAGRGTWRWP